MVQTAHWSTCRDSCSARSRARTGLIRGTGEARKTSPTMLPMCSPAWGTKASVIGGSPTLHSPRPRASANPSASPLTGAVITERTARPQRRPARRRGSMTRRPSAIEVSAAQAGSSRARCETRSPKPATERSARTTMATRSRGAVAGTGRRRAPGAVAASGCVGAPGPARADHRRRTPRRIHTTRIDADVGRRRGKRSSVHDGLLSPSFCCLAPPATRARDRAPVPSTSWTAATCR